MMIDKVEIIFGGGPIVQKLRISFFTVQATFLPASTNEPHQSCGKGVFRCFTTFHQISSQNIDRKISFL